VVALADMPSFRLTSNKWALLQQPSFGDSVVRNVS
jgi:hypothetical protein